MRTDGPRNCRELLTAGLGLSNSKSKTELERPPLATIQIKVLIENDTEVRASSSSIG